MTTTDLEPLPRCSQHGTMTLRPADRQAVEQLWCGTWYDCTGRRCLTSVLLPSPELRAHLATQTPVAAR